MKRWYEEFFDGLYARVLANQFDEATSREHARIVKRLLGLRKGQRALDVPCGMGRLTIPLARMGIVMTGVDLTASYVRRARRRAKREGLDVRFTVRDMRDIAFDREFDGVFNWFTSFGYFSDADNLRAAEAAFRALKPGGRFLVETMNKSRLLAHWRPDANERTIGGVRVVDRPRWDAKHSRVRMSWTFAKGKRIEHRRGAVRIYSGAEMRALLRAAGFHDVTFHGSLFGKRFTRHSRRLIAVGRRPRT